MPLCACSLFLWLLESLSSLPAFVSQHRSVHSTTRGLAAQEEDGGTQR